MPKINVYLPDDLADAVRDAELPVSAICQRALAQAVRRTTAIRQALLDDLHTDRLAARLPSFTARLVTTLTGAADRAKAAGAANVTTGDLLAGMIGEGGRAHRTPGASDRRVTARMRRSRRPPCPASSRSGLQQRRDLGRDLLGLA